MGNSNNEVVGFSSGGGGEELVKKSGKLSKGLKLSKSGNSKGKILTKFKKLSKIGNLPNFDAKKASLSFLTLEARPIFNHLQLTFIEAPILQYFDPEYHIWIETDVLGYAIGGVLSLLTSITRPDGIVTKIDLGQWHSVAFFFRKKILAET